MTTKNKKLDQKIFQKYLRKARHQFVLKNSDNIYYVRVSEGTVYDNRRFVAHNETRNTIDIISYNEIQEMIIDGKKIYFQSI